MHFFEVHLFYKSSEPIFQSIYSVGISHLSRHVFLHRSVRMASLSQCEESRFDYHEED